MDEDTALAALLTAIEDLHNIRNEMHACIKQVSDVELTIRKFVRTSSPLNSSVPGAWEAPRYQSTGESDRNATLFLLSPLIIVQGFLNMARARRTLGWNSVSVLDTREEYNAEVTISMLVTYISGALPSIIPSVSP